MKNYKGSLISLKLKGRKNSIEGVVVDYDNDWTFLKYNAVDYVLDGFILINNKKIKGFQRGKDELFKEKIIKLKEDVKYTEVFPFDLKMLINTLTAQGDMMQIETNSEIVTYVGYANYINEETISLKTVKANGKRGKKMTILVKEICTLQFKNDYLDSLKLYLKNIKHK